MQMWKDTAFVKKDQTGPCFVPEDQVDDLLRSKGLSIWGRVATKGKKRKARAQSPQPRITKTEIRSQVTKQAAAPAPTVRRAAPRQRRASPAPRRQMLKPEVRTKIQAVAKVNTNLKRKRKTKKRSQQEVLVKELYLGISLYQQAQKNINKDILQTYSESKTLTMGDKEVLRIYTQFLSLVGYKGAIPKSTELWEGLNSHLNGSAEDAINYEDKMNQFIERVDYGVVRPSKYRHFKQEFVDATSLDEGSPEIKPIKDYLCEAFCLVDIISELQELGYGAETK